MVQDCIILQVDKLKILSESLANSTSKAEKRMLDHRYCVLGPFFFFFWFLCTIFRICMFMYAWLHNLHVHAFMDHNGCIACMVTWLIFFGGKGWPFIRQ